MSINLHSITCDHCGEDIIHGGVVLWTREALEFDIAICIAHESCAVNKVQNSRTYTMPLITFLQLRLKDII